MTSIYLNFTAISKINPKPSNYDDVLNNFVVALGVMFALFYYFFYYYFITLVVILFLFLFINDQIFKKELFILFHSDYFVKACQITGFSLLNLTYSCLSVLFTTGYYLKPYMIQAVQLTLVRSYYITIIMYSE